MKADANKTWNLRRLDVAEFARAGGRHRASTPVQQLQRLASERFVTHDGADDGVVDWSVCGELRPAQSGSTPDVWLQLQAQTRLALTCQRCLGPVQTTLSVDRWFRFVADETIAAALDAECEEDLLALEPRPDILELLEDELLMSLPLVSLHEECPSGSSVPMTATPPLPQADRPHPFAALAQLKKTPKG